MARVNDRTALHPGAELIAAADQLNDRVVVFDAAYRDWDDPDAVVWEYYPEKESFAAASDVKFRRNTCFGCDAVIMNASCGYAAAVRFPDGKLLFETENTAQNVHACELTPHGFFAVASSTGCEVRVFSTALGDGAYSTVHLAHAHGVLWDPSLDRLWMLGLDRLLAFRVGTGDDGLPVLEEDEALRCMIPEEDTCGHDLYPVCGDPDRLWVTAGLVYQYSKREKKMLLDYPGAQRAVARGVKSMGNMPGSGTLVRTVPNGMLYSWNTDTVDLFVPMPDGQYRHEVRLCHSGAFYKARAWYGEYQ